MFCMLCGAKEADVKQLEQCEWVQSLGGECHANRIFIRLFNRANVLSPIHTTEADIFNLTDLYVIPNISDGNNVLIYAQKMQRWEWEIRDFPNALKIILDKVVKMANFIK